MVDRARKYNDTFLNETCEDAVADVTACAENETHHAATRNSRK